MATELLHPLTLPSGLPLPLGYRWTHAHGIVSLTPWHFIEAQERALSLRAEFLHEAASPNPTSFRDWMPFAHRQDCDDVAGFVLADGCAEGSVQVVHLTWKGCAESPGFPRTTCYSDFWDWFVRDAIPATRDWATNNEEDIPDLLAERTGV